MRDLRSQSCIPAIEFSTLQEGCPQEIVIKSPPYKRRVVPTSHFCKWIPIVLTVYRVDSIVMADGWR